MTKINFDSVTTYLEITLVFVIIMTGTYLYSFGISVLWICPIVILFYSIIIIIVTFNKYKYINEDEDTFLPERPNTLGASYIWIFWLIYGILFKDVIFLLPSSAFYIQNVIAIAIIVFTYMKSEIYENLMLSSTLLIFAIFLLFLPLSFQLESWLPQAFH